MSKEKRAGRVEPYTDSGIRRLTCVRCGERARFQWNACADKNLWRPVCGRCDVALNQVVLTFIGDPDAALKTQEYAAKKGVDYHEARRMATHYHSQA